MTRIDEDLAPMNAEVPMNEELTLTDAAVMSAHPDLPALTVLLDPERLRAETAGLDSGPLRLDRLRLKPGASVTAMLRPEGGVGSWVLARGFALEPWKTKRHKDLRAAADAGLPGRELVEARLVLIPAAADRQLRRLAPLRPDTGCCVPAPRRVAAMAASVSDTLSDPADQDWRLVGNGGAFSPATERDTETGRQSCPVGQVRVRTLSHNPSRRWVGVADTGRSKHVLRLHHDRRVEVLPWVPGRMWRPGDALPDELVTGWAASGALPHGAQPGLPFGRLPLVGTQLPAMLRAASTGLHMLHEPWGDRADAVVRAIVDRLSRVPSAPAHGDLTPDQVVVDGDRLTVLDWDRAGLWPVGWDVASWTAGLVVAGWCAGDGSAAVTGRVNPVVLAAAAILRGPEPFRRRHPAWAERTAALLTHAERALA
ncbi:MAG TPA: hypothetical protein GXZ30_08245 [Propionibacterium sp.]|jgi:hypothetical protein|nr:hypothetical protein [Propionibacterium sp.]